MMRMDDDDDDKARAISVSLTGSGRVESSRVESSRVRSSRVGSGPVESGRVRWPWRVDVSSDLGLARSYWLIGPINEMWRHSVAQ